MKTLVCCIGKNENRYINEFIEHYKNLGITNICLYDNNDVGGERFEDKIQDYIDDEFVIMHNVRGIKNCQCAVYANCYEEYKDVYDWILFIDCDEYLELVHNDNIEEFLSYDIFKEYNAIHLNWMIYTDNDKLYYEDKPLKERFVKPMNYDTMVSHVFPENYHIKTILRGGLDNVVWESPHTPENITSCDQYGISCINFSVLPYNFSVAYFRHYSYKTIDEYCDKLLRGFPCEMGNYFENCLRSFFTVNELTEEKVKIANEKLEKIGLELSYENMA